MLSNSSFYSLFYGYFVHISSTASLRPPNNTYLDTLILADKMYNISITTYMSIKPFKKLILLKLLINTFCVYCDFLNKNLYNNCMNMHSFLNTFYLRYKVIKGSDVFVYQKYIKHSMCYVLSQWMLSECNNS